MVVNILSSPMEKLEELLPGIEEFLCTDLAEECLSDSAEEKRQYFIERLDILKLPPSIPPRRPVSGTQSSPLPLTTSPVLPLTTHDDLISPTEELPDGFFENDFAAHQREISRSLVSNDINENEEKEVKVYDDIDTGLGPTQSKSDEANDEQDGVNFYEIPVVKQTQASCKSDDTNGYEETKGQKEDSETKDVSVNKDGEPPPPPPPLPPPLPPRRERTSSDAHSRSSIGSLLDDRPPDLPIRPNLPSKLEISTMSADSERHEKMDLKSDKSDEHTDDLTDDLDATSYESYDELDHEAMNKLDVKLPKPLKKTKKHKKLSKSRSSKEWDVNLPYNCLEEVTLSGELYYKGKLSWTKKIVALSDGRMICYKPEKIECKPALVIQLIGYQAMISEKEHRKGGFDIKLTHPELEVHNFSADFKEWAQTWCDYICAMAQGKQPPGHYYHLARTTTFTTGLDNTYSSKNEYGTSMTNISIASSDGLELDYSSSSLKRRNKKHSGVKRVGSIVFRATQFLETMGKKSGKNAKKGSCSATQSPSLTDLRERSSSSGSTPLTPVLTPMSAPDTPVFTEESPLKEFPAESFDYNILHKGHLNIYSSFNKRKWGKRWCLVRGNRFECYRNEGSTVCELDFLLKHCILRRAVEETKSELGLMLLEQKSEKITVEPLSAKEMGRWLKVLMTETATENLPEGLSKYWIEEDESPYHDIKPEEITSLRSRDHSSSSSKVVDKPNCKCQSLSSCEQTLDSPNPDGNKTLTLSSLETTTDSSTLDTSQCSVNSADNSNSYIPGEVTGDLYTQVRKNSVTEELCEVSNIGSTFIESQRSYKTHIEHKSTSWRSSPSNSNTKSSAFFLSESDMKEGSLFAEIVTNINKRFSEHDSDTEVPSSDAQTDTAYNSASCSENSSLERKNRMDSNSLTHSQNDLDSLSQCTDRQTSPIEDNVEEIPSKERIIEIQVLSPLKSENTALDNYQTDLKSNETMANKQKFIDISKTEVIHGQTTSSVCGKSSREQCDSAIFEGESILEDEESLIHKIEQLRTHLVELKKNRIMVRDRQKDTDLPSQRLSLEDEYNRLDEECKTVTDEITLLENQLVR